MQKLDLPQSLPHPTISSYVNQGWFELVEQLHQDIVKLCPEYQLDQVKEKFGSLRYYVTLPSNISENSKQQINNLISQAEKKSSISCVVCGKPGNSDSSIYSYAPYCPQHKKVKI